MCVTAFDFTAVAFHCMNEPQFIYSKYCWLSGLLEKALAPHSSTLTWKIPWTEKPGRLQSMGLLRVGHDWATSLSFSLSCIGEGNGNPPQCSCLENPRDGGAWWAAVYGVAQSQTDRSDLAAAAAASISKCRFRRVTYINVVQQISRMSSCKTKTLWSLKNSLFPSPQPWQAPQNRKFYELSYFTYLMYIGLYSFCLFVIDVIRCAQDLKTIK